MKRSLLGWALLCVLSTASLASAQSATTSLRGTIKDPTGAVVPDAAITITNAANGQTLSTKAGSPPHRGHPRVVP